MFELFEFLADINHLREIGLDDSEVEGYLEMFLENYDSLFYSVETV